ncbi:hypothetical protein IAG44_42650 [Streptomyces roseirectus]|uniref:Uncharacterized protein n=1 Tax=Streptomyces roseirectus TaxID=2768066 RepID=A0A7H0IRN4_9ACTN|nr:hypothetical protein [Streptomyces roseirectus]QNP75450.1 hypothetical protein IAG44_42650 [Streptomyces roseirectus]
MSRTVTVSPSPLTESTVVVVVAVVWGSGLFAVRCAAFDDRLGERAEVSGGGWVGRGCRAAGEGG